MEQLRLYEISRINNQRYSFKLLNIFNGNALLSMIDFLMPGTFFRSELLLFPSSFDEVFV